MQIRLIRAIRHGYDRSMTGHQPPYGPPQPPQNQPPQPPYGPPAQPDYGPPGYAAPAYGAPAYGPPGYRPPAPKPTSTKGPKITFWIGVAVLAVATVVGVLAVRAIAGVIPTDVISSDGSPGGAVLGVVDVPGSGEVTLEQGTYSFYLITQDRDTTLSGSPTVTTPSGAVERPGTGGSSSYQNFNSHRAELVAVFEADRSGVHTIEVPDTLDGGGGRLYITQGASMGEFLGDVFSGVFGIIACAGLGLTGFVLVVVGAIMWGVRRGNARRAAA